MQIHLGQGVLLGVRMVFKGHPLKVHAAVGHLGDRLLGRGDLRLFLQHLGDAVGTGQRAGQQQKHIGEHNEGIHDLEHIAQESGELPHQQSSIQNHVSAEPHNQHHGSVHGQL